MSLDTLEIDGHVAVVSHDNETKTWRGEAIGLNGGADFVASDLVGLANEGRKSLELFLETCRKANLAPYPAMKSSC